MTTGDLAGVERVRFHASRTQTLFFAGTFGLLAVMPVVNMVMFWSRLNPDVEPGQFVSAVCSAAFALCIIWYFCRKVGVVLTPDTLVVYNARRRTIAWVDVAEVRIESFMGNRVVVLYEWSGRRTRLRMPTTGFLNWDRRFDEKAQVIWDRWVASRALLGTAAVMPRIGPYAGFSGKPDRLRTRPAAAQRSTVALLLLVVAVEMAFSALTPRSAGDDLPFFGRVIELVVSLAALAGIWQWCIRVGITLTPALLISHRRLRRLQIPWTQVESIQIERRHGGHRLVVREEDGRLTRLPCPRIGFLFWDREFDIKAMTIHRWWQLHRGDEPGLASEYPAAAHADGFMLTGRGAPGALQGFAIGLFTIAASITLAVMLVIAIVAVA